LSNSSIDDGSYQPFDGSFMLMSSDPLLPLEIGTKLLPEMSNEDAQYVDFFEGKLTEEENAQADP